MEQAKTDEAARREGSGGFSEGLGLVEELRLIAAWNLPGGPYPGRPQPDKYKVCTTAAAEIERLRAELAEAATALPQAVRAAVAAERERRKTRAVQIVEWHRNDYNRQQIDPIVTELRNGL